jgi:c-di-GMP-binding flagellar brake protein YcgR
MHSLPFGNDYFCKCPRILAFHSQKQEEIKFETESHIKSSHLKRLIEDGYIQDRTGKKHVLKERRRNYRIRIDLPVHFTFSTGQEINLKEGVSLDISDTGMCFFTDEPLSKGSYVELRMQHIWVSPKKSTVMWCSMITPELYRVGVSFH